jgi:pyruvate,water dikinase
MSTLLGRPLSELRRGDEPGFGGKSAALGELLAAGIRVPAGFAISCSAFDLFVQEARIGPAIAATLAGLGKGDLEETEAASRAIAAAMRQAPMPVDVRSEIESRYADLAAQLGAGQPPVAVRSSAIGEDSAEAAFAGQQETYLWVRGANNVCNAVRDCWISLYSPTAISYRAHLDFPSGGPPTAATSAASGTPRRELAMGVTVQLMVDSAISGVLFTCNPVSGDPSMVAINASWGLGLAVVGGEVTPDDYLISKVTREVVREQLGAKQVEYVPDAEHGGVTLREVEPERAGARCLEAAAITELVAIARASERHFGCHQDVEWAIARDGVLPANVFVVQSRPVTTVAPPAAVKPAANSAIAMVMAKFGAGPTGAGS